LADGPSPTHIKGSRPMQIELNKDNIKMLKRKIQTYFLKEHEDSLGDLKAEMILEFFIRELGPQIYNQALKDAQAFMQDKLIDLDVTLSVPEYYDKRSRT
jgi:uncharacterized protein (DUF2164 family)